MVPSLLSLRRPREPRTPQPETPRATATTCPLCLERPRGDERPLCDACHLDAVHLAGRAGR